MESLLKEALEISVQIMWKPLLYTTIASLFISVVMAVMQIQDQSLSLVVKVLVVVIVLKSDFGNYSTLVGEFGTRAIESIVYTR